jgi:hypothetical protein
MFPGYFRTNSHALLGATKHENITAVRAGLKPAPTEPQQRSKVVKSGKIYFLTKREQAQKDGPIVEKKLVLVKANTFMIL